MIYRETLAVCAAALIVSAGAIQSAFAQTDQIGALSITDPWTRATPPRAQSAGGFVTIDNAGDEPDRLIGATSSIAGRVELHEMRMADGTMLMRPVKDGIALPSGDRVTLAPGGLHIMFMELNRGLHEGDTITVTLGFEHAGQIEVPFPVQAIGARGPASAEQPEEEIGNGHEHGAGK